MSVNSDFMGQKKFIAVSGNIGTGKSSMVEFLCSHFPLKPLHEPNTTNPYIEDFYGNMFRWAFHSQLYFLISRFRLHVSLQSKNRAIVMDRTIYEDAEIFAKNLYLSRILNKRDYQMYRELYNTLVKSLRPPDIMIYLHCSVRSIKKRIQMRGRAEEQNIDQKYLARLNRHYERWIESYDRSEVIRICTEKYDYIADMIDRIDLIEKIDKLLKC
jgi:deoxyadenosine/deoxycytidine kinase